MKTALSTSFLLLSLTGFVAAPSPGAAVTPTQWVAKIYTEALGRIPDTSGWQNGYNTFAALGCNAAALKTHGRTVYLSTEYMNQSYDNAARLLTLYRGVLNREPDSTGFNSNLNYLNTGGSWTTVVDSLFATTEFQQLAPVICGTTPYYSFGGGAVLNLPISGTGLQGGTGAQLQTALNNASHQNPKIVYLAQKAVYRLTAPLVIPAGVTLTTTGLPPHNNYALQGRLVRASSFEDAMVKVSAGAKLQNVWVDGQRAQIGYGSARISVEMEGGTNTTVGECRLTDPAGGTNLKAYGPCAHNTISHNVATGYATNHYNGLWADGLTVACEDTLVELNEIIDATDVGIVLFGTAPAVQKSQVRYNGILAAGNSAYGGIVADPWVGTTTQDFTGSSIYENTIWSGAAHLDFVLSVGTRAWFGTSSNTGTGADFHNNTTNGFQTNTGTGIGVSGMQNAYVQGNNLMLNVTNLSSCPHVSVGASVSAGLASGSIQAYTDVLIQSCIGH